MSHLQEAPWCQVRLLQLVEVGHRREDSGSPALLGKGVTSRLGDNMHRAGLDVLCFAARGQSGVPKLRKTSRFFFSHGSEKAAEKRGSPGPLAPWPSALDASPCGPTTALYPAMSERKVCGTWICSV